MVIAVDFDGTCVTHAYPYLGEDIGAIPILKRIQEEHKIILYTMRCGDELKAAVKHLTDNGIHLYGINHNKAQAFWNKSPKIYANYYLDDAALGTPLLFDPELSSREYVDWVKMEQILIDKGIIKAV